MMKCGKIGALALSSLAGFFFVSSSWAQVVEEDEVIQECEVPEAIRRNFILRVNADVSTIAIGQSRRDLEGIQQSTEGYELAYHLVKFDEEVTVGEMEIEVDREDTKWYPYRMSVEYGDREYVLSPTSWFKMRDDYYYIYQPVGACERDIDEDSDDGSDNGSDDASDEAPGESSGEQPPQNA